MSIIEAIPTPVKTSPGTLTIKGTSHTVEPNNASPLDAPVATVTVAGEPHAARPIPGRDGGTFWRLIPLTDPTGRDTEVDSTPEAGILRCDCREHRSGSPCRHVVALLDAGMIDAPADQWPAWTDEDRWELGPDETDVVAGGWVGLESIPAGPDDDERLTLTEYLESVQARFRAIGSGAADLIADELAGLVNEAIILGRPTDAETFWDRRAAMLDRVTGD